MVLDASDFDGTLPSCLGNLFGLERLYVFKNRLSSHVHGGLMSLQTLTELGVKENDTSGGLDQDQTDVYVGATRWIEYLGQLNRA